MHDHEDLSETFTVLCQHCGEAMRARPEHVGMAARCPFCENVTTLSLPANDPPQAPQAPPPIPPPQKARRRKRVRPEDSQPAARLRNTKNPKSNVYKTLICAAVSHDNRFFAASVQGPRTSTQTGGGSVILFDAATGATKFTTPETKNPIGSLQFSPDDRHILAVDVRLDIYRWLASTGALVPSRQQMPGRGGSADTAPPLVSPDSKFALGSGQVFGGGIVAIDTAPSTSTRTKTLFQYGGRAGLRMRNEPNMTAVHALAISGDSRSFAAAGLQFRLKKNGGLAPGFGKAKERVTIWRVGKDWKPINVKIAGELDLSKKTVTALALSPNGKQIAVATWETTEVRIVEVATGKTLATVKHGEGGNVSTLAFSHYGKWLATSGGYGNGANRDPNTRVWDVGDLTGGR